MTSAPIIQVEDGTFDLLLTALHALDLSTGSPYAIIVFGKSDGMNPEVIAYNQNEYEVQATPLSGDNMTAWESAGALAIFIRKTPPHVHEFKCICGVRA
jgi:hypothetical protein